MHFPLIAQLITLDLKYISEEEFKTTCEEAKKIAKQIDGLMVYLKIGNKKYTKKC